MIKIFSCENVSAGLSGGDGDTNPLHHVQWGSEIQMCPDFEWFKKRFVFQMVRISNRI